jgi:peptide/nickel transport system permease protein
MVEVHSKAPDRRTMVEPYALPRWKQRLAKITRNLKGIFGFLVIAVVLLCAVFSPLLSPQDPYTQSLEARLVPPVWEKGGQKDHLLGTDHLGRDMLSRLIYGSRVSVIVGFTAIFISGTIGVFLGLVAGYFSRFAGAVIMRIVDMFLSIPYVLMAIAVIAAIGTGLFNLILVLALTRWAHYARIMNGTVIKIKGEEYIEAAHARGNTPLRIMLRQILPNAIPPILVLATLELAFMIIMEATLSFLGLGVQPPTPTWGLMSSEGREYITVAWWIITFSGLAIVFTVLGANLLGDWLRDILDPRLKA